MGGGGRTKNASKQKKKVKQLLKVSLGLEPHMMKTTAVKALQSAAQAAFTISHIMFPR